MRGSEYAELAAFVAVVDQGSFARAARHLRVAPSSLSQTVKKLEARLGVELLHRTTRSVAMTGAGVRLFQRFKPAMVEMEAAVVDVHESGAAPAGLVRLHMPGVAYAGLVKGRLGELHRRYPRIHLDSVTDDALVDSVRAGYDLDVRMTGALDPSVSALAIGGPVRHVAVAAPAYLAEHGAPETPADLAHHRCIQWRRPGTDHPYRWIFQVAERDVLVDVEGPLTVSHCDAAVVAAVDSVGIAFVLEQHAAYALSRGKVREVLSPFLPSFPGWSVCHSRTNRLSAATEAVMRFLAEGAAPNTATLNP